MSDARTRMIASGAALAVLAIGILMGSGPLRSSLLGDTGDRIATLEAEVADASAAAADAAARADAAVDYIDGAAPALLAGLLPEATVLIVDAPGAPDEAGAAVASRLPLAGAAPAGPVSLGDAWADAGTETFRVALAEQLAPSLVGVTVADAESALAHAFAQGATGGAPTGTDFTDIEAAGADRGAVLWELLAQADLASGERADEVDAVVIVAGEQEATAMLVDVFAAYDAPVTVLGVTGSSDTATTAAAARDDVATLASSYLTLGGVTAIATVAETLQGGRPDYGPGEVPWLLGVSGAAPTTDG